MLRGSATPRSSATRSAISQPAYRPCRPDMALATILFADAVGFAEDARSGRNQESPVGDWRAIARNTLAQFRGREIDKVAGNSLPYSTDQAAQCGALKL